MHFKLLESMTAEKLLWGLATIHKRILVLPYKSPIFHPWRLTRPPPSDFTTLSCRFERTFRQWLDFLRVSSQNFCPSLIHAPCTPKKTETFTWLKKSSNSWLDWCTWVSRLSSMSASHDAALLKQEGCVVNSAELESVGEWAKVQCMNVTGDEEESRSLYFTPSGSF